MNKDGDGPETKLFKHVRYKRVSRTFTAHEAEVFGKEAMKRRAENAFVMELGSDLLNDKHGNLQAQIGTDPDLPGSVVFRYQVVLLDAEGIKLLTKMVRAASGPPST